MRLLCGGRRPEFTAHDEPHKHTAVFYSQKGHCSLVFNVGGLVDRKRFQACANGKPWK